MALLASELQIYWKDSFMNGKIIPEIRKSTPWVNAARIILVLLIITNVWVIWYNSAKVAADSDKTSKKVATDVAEVVVENYSKLEKKVQKQHVGRINNTIRSLGHFAEFVPLGLLFFFLAESIYSLSGKKRLRRMLFCTVFAVLLSMICATGDEIHQLFVKGRTFQAVDILCDSLGALCGCALAGIITLFLRKRIFK